MSLIHWWKLDETSGSLLDSVGTAHGTATGTTSVPGLFGNARKFAAAGDRIDCGLPSDLQFTTGPLSISLWFKQSTIPSNNWYLFSRDGSGNRSYIAALTPTGELSLSVFDSGGTPYTFGITPSLADGLLHNVVATRSGTVGRLYVDGVLFSTAAAPVTINAGSSPFIIGNNPWDFNYYYFRDTIDNVQVWDEELTAEYISDLYYEALPPLSSLSLANRVPGPDDTDVVRDANIQLSVVDNANNIDLTTARIWVDGALAYDGSAVPAFKPGFDGPASAQSGTPAQYDFIIDPTTDFDYDATVTVDVYAENDVGRILDTGYGFSVTQDVTEPALDNRSPSPGQINVAWNSDIYLEIYEVETLVARNSIEVSVAGTLAFAAGSFQSGFTGSVLPADATAERYYVTINPAADFPDGTVVAIHVEADNTSVPVDHLNTTYDFTTYADTTAPVLQDQLPAPGAVLQAKDTDVYLEIADAETGVKFSSITIDIDRGSGYETVFTAGAFVGDYTGSVVPDPVLGTRQYNVTIDPGTDFAEGTAPVVRVQCTDNATTPNSMTDSYAFGVAFYPALGGLEPSEGATGVSRNTNVTLTLAAGSAPVVASSIEVTIAGELAYDGDGTPAGFQPGFQGPDSNIYAAGGGWTLIIDKETPLPQFTVVDVEAEAVDTLGHAL